MEEIRFYRDKNLQIIFGVTLMAVLGVASIAPAFPRIMDELDISGGQIGLLITFFTMPGVFLAPFRGVLADRFGRKRILVPSLFLFAIAGAACYFARDFNVLLVLRVFQGVGGASLGSLNATIIGDLYPERQRVQAMGANASVLSIGTALYPIIGGALALIGWYYPFALPIVAIPIGILVLTSLKNPEPKSHQALKEYLWGTWRCLKDIKAAGLFAAGVLTFIILYGAYITYFALLLENSFGASPLIIGLIMSAMAFTTAIVSSQLGRMNRWLSLGAIIKLPFAVYALALALIPLMPSLWLLLIPSIIFGIAQGANIPSIQTGLVSIAPMEYRAAFMSISATMLRLGQTVGPPLMGLVYVCCGMDAVFYVAAALALMAPAAAIVFGKRSTRSELSG